MIEPFTFSTAGEIAFGRGASRSMAERVLGFGHTVLLVRGASGDRAAWLRRELEAGGAGVTEISVAREPDLSMVAASVERAREAGANVVAAVGGGSVIDAAKAIAALVPATRPLMDHLEVVGKGLPLEADPLPFVAAPTTAGTGAEVTRNAVIAVPEHRRKVSLRDRRMLPALAIVDPALTDGCPWGVTLASGLDAVTQVIEPYLSTRSNPMTDALCRAAIPMGLGALKRLSEAEDEDARDRLAWVSLAGGLALANAGLGVVHGLAGPLGGLSGAAHGAICGALLPHGIAANEQGAETERLTTRIDEVRGWIADALGCSPEDALEKLADWSREAGLPGLDAQGVSDADRIAAAEAAEASSSMKANPVVLSKDTLNAVLEAAR